MPDIALRLLIAVVRLLVLPAVVLAVWSAGR
jgi:hypothetical protein